MKSLKSNAISLTLPLFLFSCNKNEFAPLVELQSFTLDENPPGGQEIGSVIAVDLDVTQLIRDNILDKGNSHGLLLKLQNENPYRMALLASSDHPMEQLRPKLEVHYTIAE